MPFAGLKTRPNFVDPRPIRPPHPPCASLFVKALACELIGLLVGGAGKTSMCVAFFITIFTQYGSNTQKKRDLFKHQSSNVNCKGISMAQNYDLENMPYPNINLQIQTP